MSEMSWLESMINISARVSLGVILLLCVVGETHIHPHKTMSAMKHFVCFLCAYITTICHRNGGPGARVGRSGGHTGFS